MDDIRAEIEDIKGLAAANALILGEIVPIMHRMAPAEIGQLVTVLEAMANRPSSAGADGRAHVKEFARHLREKIGPQP